MKYWMMPYIALMLSSTTFSQVTFDIEYTDTRQFGFNDETPVTPVGNNTGTTLGAQRRQALEYSLKQFETMLHSDIPIHIKASFANYGGNQHSATLASAGPEWFNVNFPKSPKNNIAYPSALANKISGQDLSDENRDIADIILSINADIDNTALGSSTFYYGLNSQVPSLDIDFVTVVSHEIMHGLGFLSAIDPFTGHKFRCESAPCPNDIGDIYSTFLSRMISNQPTPLLKMSQNERLAAITAENQVVWTGAATETAASQLFAGKVNTFPLIYTPNPVEIGSSLSHTDFSLQSTELMQPAYSGFLPITPVNMAMLSDMGWGDISDLEIHLRVTHASSETANVIITLSNNGNTRVNNIKLNFTHTQSNITTFETELTCEAQSNSQLECTLASLAAQQIYQAEFSISRHEEQTNALILTAAITANILDTAPNNNNKTLEVLESRPRNETIGQPNSSIQSSTLETTTQGGTTNLSLLLILGLLFGNHLRRNRRNLR